MWLPHPVRRCATTRKDVVSGTEATGVWWRSSKYTTKMQTDMGYLNKKFPYYGKTCCKCNTTIKNVIRATKDERFITVLTVETGTGVDNDIIHNPHKDDNVLCTKCFSIGSSGEEQPAAGTAKRLRRSTR